MILIETSVIGSLHLHMYFNIWVAYEINGLHFMYLLWITGMRHNFCVHVTFTVVHSAAEFHYPNTCVPVESQRLSDKNLFR